MKNTDTNPQTIFGNTGKAANPETAPMPGMMSNFGAEIDPAMLQEMMKGMTPETLTAAMSGMPGGAEDAGKNPFEFPEMSEEEMAKMQVLSALSMKLLENNATPKDIAEAKKVLGEEEVNSILKEYEEMPEEEKKAAVEYQKLYKAMSNNLEVSLKEQGADVNDPNMNPETFVKGMSGMFKRLISEQKDNPEFVNMMNMLGENVYNKDMLYSPLKKLCDLYPVWLENNKEKLPKEDFAKYTEQFKVLEEICKLFESNEKNPVKLIELVTKMEEYGSPPEEITKQVQMPDLLGQVHAASSF